ncbi:hypothetical protein UlMin_032462 [Ulmus minor]
MGVLGCLQFAVKFFLDFLAWPLLALGYPLCASIKAIETNSVSDTQKLNTYWVVFSLILLFEHASAKLLQWFSFWPYIRLMIVCLLVIPYFDGASYVYKHLFCYCLSLDSQIVINWFNKWMESLFKREKLLAEVASFVKENGTEALEKLITSKSDGTNSFEAEEIKAVSSIEFKLVNKSNLNEPDVEPVVVLEKNEVTTVSQVSQAEPNIVQTEKQIIATVETIETVADVAPGRELPQTSKPVQREWTCSMCKVTAHCETVFILHLQGQKHKKAVFERMKVKNQTDVPKIVQHSNTSKNQTVQPKFGLSNIQKKSDHSGQSNPKNISASSAAKKPGECKQAKVRGQQQKNQNKKTVAQNGLFPYCSLCNVSCASKVDMASHVRGRGHLIQVQMLA